MITLRSGAAIGMAALLGACSGGGAGSTSGSVAPTYAGATVSISIAVPRRTPAFSHAHRRPHYISTKTKSIVFALTEVNGSTPPSGFNSTLVVNTTAGSGDCGQDTGATGGLICHGTMTAPVATDTFSVIAYDQTGGAGNILSSADVVQAIPSGSYQITLTLNPVVASLTWSPSAASAGNGTAAGNSVALEALDADGQIIIPVASGCGTNCTEFNEPIYLQSDGKTPDYIGWTCSTDLGFYTGSTHATQARGEGSTLTNGTSISTPDSAQSSGTVTAPNGTSVDLIGNNGAYAYYDGTAQAASVGSLTCSAVDSQSKSATFTLTLENGSIGWTVN
ncbi:MAG TPA: hypothetical protein VMH02_02960 [Verrucomicrobiae bacterium]|nr:hypothetical protein [Verrucomicrobiae bacterium]